MRYPPMMAESIQYPFDDKDWIFEVKWDGIRAIAYVGETVTILSRNSKELQNIFPELIAIKTLTKNTVLDGEIIIMQGGLPHFPSVAARIQATNRRDIDELSKTKPAIYIVFDILEIEDESLIGRPLNERKMILRNTLKESDHIVISSYIDEKGKAYYDAALERGLEGIIAKRKNSFYQPSKRSRDWLKIKKVKTADFVILGYTKGKGERESSFGALLLGLYKEEELVYFGRVGTGFSDKIRSELAALFIQHKTDKKQVEIDDLPNDVTWIKPNFVAEVGYQSLTDDDRLRAPRFIRLRNDKASTDCVLDQVKAVPLENYNVKRDFTKTPEPKGREAPQKGSSYVIQEHHARHLHWDLRLEKDGVLKSWAVPKQLPEKPGERRLAVMVEDHPLEYGSFEGTIPEGEYGAGTVKIWDRGTYDLLKWAGEKIEVVLHGSRLNGQYEFIKFKKAGENQWLLFKKKES